MTTRGIPLGRKESQRLEFKSRDSLQDRYKIGREVVGMLNADQGGEIWIGLGEEEHRAVQVERIADAEVEARSLQDFLVDSLEPAPLPGEVEIQVKESEEGEGVLRIQVEGSPERRPYALLRKGTRYYGVRVKDRLRPMTREEILTPREQGAQDSQEAVVHKVLAERERVLNEEDDLLWLRVEPTKPVELDLQAPLFDELVRDPAVTNNRRAGWHFTRSDHRPVLGKGRLSWNLTWLEMSIQRFSVEIREQGGFEFRLHLMALASAEALPPGASRTINPLKLSEYLVSAFRISSTVYADEVATLGELPPEFVADLLIMGLEGAVLMRQRGRVDPEENPLYREERDFILAGGPLVFEKEVLHAPDRCGFRLMRKIYEAFGLREEKLPKEFDRKTGRLILPE